MIKINYRKVMKMIKGGLLACLVPLAFDLCASFYTGYIAMYAPPFLYPIFFCLGAGSVIEALHKEDSEKDG